MSAIFVQQSILLGLAIATLVVVRHYGKRDELTFVLVIMWSAIALVGAAAALLLPNIGVIGDSLGVVPAALFAGAASVILGLIALLLSLRVSRLEVQQQDLAESIGRQTVDLAELKASELGETLVVVPALNEAATIGSVVRDLTRSGLPVLVVDDGSTDETGACARAEGAAVLTLPINLGVGGALRAGFGVALRAGFTQALQCDADGQHPIRAVLALLEAQARSNADLLIGSRFLDPKARRREGLVRFIATFLLARVASRSSGQPITDATSGLRIVRRPLLDEVARSMPAHYLGDTFEVNVMAGRSGYVIEEIPVEMEPRVSGASSSSTLASVRLTIRVMMVALLRLPGSGIRPRGEIAA